MPKPLWFIRNHHKLFTRFNYVIAICTLLYAILTLFVTEFQPQNLLLLIAPIIALAVCFGLHRAYLFVHHLDWFKKIKPESHDDAIKTAQDTIIGVNFVGMISVMFFQTEWINQLKQIQSSMFLPLLLCGIGFIFFAIRQTIKLIKYARS